MKEELKEILDKLIDGKPISRKQLVYLFNESGDITIEESQSRSKDLYTILSHKIIEYKRRYFQLKIEAYDKNGEVILTSIKEIKYHES